jgi:hypothetical protein
VSSIGDSFINVHDGRQWRRKTSGLSPAAANWAELPQGDRVVAFAQGRLANSFYTGADPWDARPIPGIETAHFQKQHDGTSLLVTGHIDMIATLGGYGPQFVPILEGEILKGGKTPPDDEIAMWMWQNQNWTHTWQFSRLIRDKPGASLSAGNYKMIALAGTAHAGVTFPKDASWSMEVCEVAFK